MTVEYFCVTPLLDLIEGSVLEHKKLAVLYSVISLNLWTMIKVIASYIRSKQLRDAPSALKFHTFKVSC